ncbi:deoxycytidylate deaminase isoform X2 [Melanotaenia boesemani]|uniref:deoxycytidylate deaminase isoform X2 n=1 Tax=Melanotaenia boesemani TaxID=1250792 RepID=UPI001C05AC6C|nr:deoxycytidylate deaminase isoform X2 [Melanotaenia boesemani]XP_041840304.1 deoxycytidylate deaminase isoform X2 [Melanotaenia boesemani]XP_041840306.1 deoxycytidylate deaminase isoform X2 [Melanotaenia boesemani]
MQRWENGKCAPINRPGYFAPVLAYQAVWTYESLLLDSDQSHPTQKRDDYLEWPEYFMAVAFLSAQRSKDPNSQVGACIVNPENKIVGIGYNGMPNGCDDDLLPWSRTAEDRLDTKYPYVCHAELNAIMNKNSFDVKGCTMYVALFPCNECAKLIIQAGLKEVVYLSDKYHHTPEMTASRKLLGMAGVQFSSSPRRRRSSLILTPLMTVEG